MSTRLAPLLAGACLLAAIPSSSSAVPAPAADRASSPLWGDLEPGPYAVGFRQLARYDASRVHRIGSDLDGRPRAGERSRPMRVSVWYPARPTGRAPLAWGDYAAMAAGEERFGTLTAEEVRQGEATVFLFPLFRDLLPEQRRKLAALPGLAVRDAPPARGRFPVILYSLGSTFLAHATPEYLASHGYVVVQSPRVGAVWGLPPDGRDLADLVTKVRDMDFLINVAGELPFADAHVLGAVGFSAGGRWALSEAMQNADIRAVVSLDSVMLFQDPTGEAWKRLPFFDLESVRVPVLHFIRRVWVPRQDPSLWERMTYSDRTAVVFEEPRLDHLDLQSGGWAIELAGGRPTLKPAVAAAFSLWSRWTLAFLDLYVKGDPKAREILDGRPAGTRAAPLPQGFVTVERKPAELAPPSFAQLMNAIGDGDLASVERACRRSLAERGRPLAPENALNLAGYALLFSGRARDAIRLLSINAESYPQSGNALDSLADAYLAVGEREKALELSRKAKPLVEADKSLDPERRKAILENIEGKLKRLVP